MKNEAFLIISYLSFSKTAKNNKLKNVPDKQKLKNVVLTKSTQETIKGVL